MRGERIQTVFNQRAMTKIRRIKEVYNFENDSQTIRHIVRNYYDERLSEDENNISKPLTEENPKEE